MARWNPVALSSMHHSHLGLGAVMAESDGWLRPARYTEVEVELANSRQRVGMCDISPVGKLVVHGEDVDSLLEAAFHTPVSLDVGRAARYRLPHETDPRNVVLARLANDELLVLTPLSSASSVSDSLSQAGDGCAHMVDITSALGGVRIVGPLAPSLLSAVTELDVSPPALPDMSCAQSKVADIHGTVLRRDMGDLTGFELYFGREFGEYIWEVLMEAGAVYGVTPFGTETLALLE